MQFNYEARTKSGEVQTGIIEASSKEAALDLLQRYSLFVTLLEQAKTRPFYAKKIQFSRISQKDLVVFSRQLSLMLKSRIPLIQAIDTIGGQNRNQNLKEKIMAISQEVQGGTTFSQALSKYPRLFSSFYVSMVKSGETSGTLSESLNYLADHLEKEYNLSSKLKIALTYPILVVFVVIAVFIMMVYFVIPNLARVLLEFNQELPLLTRFVIGLSNFMRAWGWILLLVFLGGGIFAFRYYFQTASGKALRDGALLRIPAIKSFLEMIYVSRFSENLSTLITGGVPIAQALEITGEIVGNDVYKEIILEIKEEVKKGESISSVLAKYPNRFPPLLSQMVLVGEKTGTLSESLLNVVSFYEKEVERALESLISLIEPVMIIVLGLLVAGLMASILIPLYKMTAV